MRLVLIVLAILFLGPPARADVLIEGRVQAGATFTQALSDGLYFFLLPTPYGWQITLADTSYIEEAQRMDLASLTPPLHGINATQLEGWHLRNADNSGPNTAGSQNLNAPGTLRDFTFFSNRGALQRERDYIDCLRQHADCADPGMPRRTGRLEILAYELGNLIPGQQAAFQTLSFRVTLKETTETPHE